MRTHPRCNGLHPGREARRGPYDLSQCHLCWLALNAPRESAAQRAARKGLPLKFKGSGD